MTHYIDIVLLLLRNCKAIPMQQPKAMAPTPMDTPIMTASTSTKNGQKLTKTTRSYLPNPQMS